MTTKDKILDVVVSYIKQGVISSISLAQIASDADVGKSTLYEYFKSKDEMIVETYQYLIKEYEKILLSPLTKTTYQDMMIEQLEHILTVMTEATTLMQTIMSQGQMTIFEIPKCMETSMITMKQKIDERFKFIFDQGIIEDKIRFTNPNPYLKHLIQAMMTGLMIQYVNKEIEISKEALLHLIFHQIQKLILG